MQGTSVLQYLPCVPVIYAFCHSAVPYMIDSYVIFMFCGF